MSLQKLPYHFNTEHGDTFNNNKTFLEITEGNGIQCDFCKSKIFYGYSNWKAHCKTKKHRDKTDKIVDLKPEQQEIKRLKDEIKKQKIITAQEANKCEQYRSSLLEIKRELKRLKSELEKKFKIK